MEVIVECVCDDVQCMVDMSEDNFVLVKVDFDIVKVEFDQVLICSLFSGWIVCCYVVLGEYVMFGMQFFDIVFGVFGCSFVEFVFFVSEGDVIGMCLGQEIELVMDVYFQQNFVGEVLVIVFVGSQGMRIFCVEFKVELMDEMLFFFGMVGCVFVI